MFRSIQTKEDIMACSDRDSRHQLADAFRGYLVRERGLAQGTVDNYSHNAALFLARLPDPLDEELIRPGGPSARSLSVPLRSLLRFLHVTGRIPRPLAGAVPTEPRWRLTSLPARIDRSAVSALLAACDRSSERGQRDYAVLVLLSRLGLRAFETAGLTLDDVDWRGGTILVRGKGGRAGRLPLPSDAGEAMASYLDGLRHQPS
jgi:integrase/recombinase XerD